MNNIVKNHLRHPAVPPGGRGDGPSGRGAPSDSEFSNISKISQNLTFRLIRTIKLSTYKAIASPLDDRQITFSDSIHLFIEAMGPGNDIFDETGEIPVVWESFERLCKKDPLGVTPGTAQCQNRSGQSYISIIFPIPQVRSIFTVFEEIRAFP